MTRALRIGLPDSGVDGALVQGIAAARGFSLGADGTVAHTEAAEDRVGHGTAIARLILDKAPAATLLIARIFDRRRPVAAIAVAAALDWLVGNAADVIAMSFGLRDDRTVLRLACASALAQGTVLVAAAPARGAPVFPASYAGVLSVTGDARCQVDQISALATPRAAFGACVRADPSRPAEEGGGASFAVGHVCGLLAAAFADRPDALDGGTARAWLDANAEYRGPEHRTGAEE